ncbi:MAG: anaerobic ribonucleoside-triphosphate reductase activating protein [Desulfobulbaceae bacterium]|jgi:pyruvate formate lyase activating enzyme|nr:anaerobic ribonucleoside-triphosphate reductase activating protein [Desulfobulbaceae bacterium]
MVIGGLQRCSFSDYPGKVAAVLFTQGCNFRCPFCHNGSLLAPKGATQYGEREVFDFLKRRQGRLGGVVISGGEPTGHADLPQFINKVKGLGFAVKLDTNGSHPEMVELLLKEELVDYLAMDIKAPLNKYDTLCGVKVDTRAIRQTISVISASKAPHHFRTTHVKPLLTESDFAGLLALVPPNSKHITQPFVAEKAWKAELRISHQ